MRKTGLAVSAGAAVGPARLYRPDRRLDGKTYGETADARFERYLSAREAAHRELENLAAELTAQGDARADVLLAQSVLLNDPELTQEIQAAVELEQTDAAVEQVFQACADLLSGLQDPLIRERSADYLDLSRRLLRILEGRPAEDWANLKEPCILVAEELPPSVAATLDRRFVLGIVTAKGGATCHTAIMARSCGIPAVLGVEGIQELVREGELLALEVCSSGEGAVWIDPDETVKGRIGEEAIRWQNHCQKQTQWLDRAGQTRDEVPIQVLLNLSTGGQRELTFEPFVDGVGLFRTEFLFLNREMPPTEEEQYHCYRQVLQVFSDRPVTLRTMDFGGDKIPRFLRREWNENPARELRGVGLSLQYPALFRTQLRAALRASVHGRLRLMLPMVTEPEEIDRVRVILRAVEEELCGQGYPVGRYQLGVMIEVPELARMAERVARDVDFASLGTNDLCQYLLGNDRNGSDRAEEYLSYHPDLLALIGQVAEAFEAENKELSLCGELAGDPMAAPVLVGLGLRKLSAAPRRVAGLKEALAAMTLEEMERLAEEILAKRTGAEVRTCLLRAQQEAKQHV